jgi:hypothetical protein
VKGISPKDSSHGLSKSIILINLYGMFPQFHKDFLKGVSHTMLLMKLGIYWRSYLTILIIAI